MRRGCDEPRTPGERLDAIEDRIDDLARLIGYAPAVLRAEGSGAVLRMATDAPHPAVGPDDIDIALHFLENGSVSVLSIDGKTARPLVASNVAATSERSLKRVLGPLRGVRAVIDAIATGRFEWLVPGWGRDAGEHHGLFVDDDLEAAAPGVIARMPDGSRMPIERALIAYLIARVQEVGRELDDLRAQLPSTGGP